MRQPAYPTPRDAETAFYEAFERADLEAMMRVWSSEDSIICIHPMGPTLHGRKAVETSWRQIFQGGGSMRFRITEPRYLQGEMLSVHCVHENIDHGPGYARHSVVIATNVYRLTRQGWRMILHHGSPGPEANAGGTSSGRALH